VGTFDTDWDAVDDMLAEVFGSTVSIHRGATSTSSVTATAVSRDYEVENADGIITVANLRDYAVDVAGYTIASSAVVPQAGDRIKESIDGTTHVFEVMRLPGRPAAEWLGNQKPQWLIHTKLVGTE